MSENPIEQEDEAQTAEDELDDQQPGETYRGEIDEDEERRRQLADEEDAE